MKFYGLKTCDTCRKALAALRSAGQVPEVVDVRADGLSRDTVAAIVAAFGTRAVNRASATWRGLDDAARALDPVDLILAHPAVMKRPVIAHQGQLFLGWDATVQNALLG